jgi:hypothetical protein
MLIRVDEFRVRNAILKYFLIVTVALLSGCGFFINRAPQVLTSAVALHPDYEPTDVVFRPSLTEPRQCEVEMVCRLDSVLVFSPVLLEQIADSLGMSVTDLPLSYVWTAEPVDRTGQRDVQYRKMQPDIALRYDDKINGNRIRFWNLTDLLKSGKTPELVRRFRFTCYRVDFQIDSTKLGRYRKNSALYKFYTQSERWLEYPGAVADTAARIVNAGSNPYDQALQLYSWLKERGVYHYPPEKRGAGEMLKTMRGDCGQFSYLFIALCRSVGIPARLVAGFKLSDEDEWGFHVWAECYLPRYGWVPVDLTEKNCEFGQLPNDRLISSVGMNLALPRTPKWANYQNSDVEQGMTDFMQMATMVRAGFQGVRFSEIRSIKNRILEQ